MWDAVDREKLKMLGEEVPLLDNFSKKSCARMTAEDEANADIGYKEVIAKLRNIFIKVAKNSNTSDYHLAVAMRCGISPDIVRRIISPANKRSHKELTPIILGCICVGLKLSKEECQYLFDRFGMPLVFGRSKFISLTMCAIRDQDDIYQYIEELKSKKIPGADRLRDPK